MNKILLALSVFFTITNAIAKDTQELATAPKSFIPTGYIVTEELCGDLNNNDRRDYVYVIKDTRVSNLVGDEKIDRNRRGLVIVFNQSDGYKLAALNPEIFSSENEDGGNYYPPELSLDIKGGNLLIEYRHGRYGYWRYNFQYRKTNFQLIGYDAVFRNGPIIQETVSINFLTEKMRIEKNTTPNAEAGDEKFSELWEDFSYSKAILLENIDDIDQLNVKKLVTSDLD